MFEFLNRKRKYNSEHDEQVYDQLVIRIDKSISLLEVAIERAKFQIK